MTQPAAPDFLVLGAPKAGTTALHAALAQHPECPHRRSRNRSTTCAATRRRPPGADPVTQHSQQEWIWRRDEYERALRRRAGAAGARREHAVLPLPRAPSGGSPRSCPTPSLSWWSATPSTGRTRNWMHLWSDGLEPVADFVEAFAREDERVAAGWAPFWRYRRARPLRRAARRPARPGRPRAGAGAALPQHRREPSRDAGPGRARSSVSPRASSTPIPPDNFRPSCDPGRGPRCWAGRSAPAPARR